MKTSLFALLCLTEIACAGMSKQNPQKDLVVNESKAAVKKIFDGDGNVDLQPLVDASAGETVLFNIDGKIVSGTIRERIVDPNQGLKLIGEIANHNKAGFLFHFKPAKDGSVNVKGILFFAESNEMFSLEYNEDKKVLYFKKQALAVRDLDSDKTK